MEPRQLAARALGLIVTLGLVSGSVQAQVLMMPPPGTTSDSVPADPSEVPSVEAPGSTELDAPIDEALLTPLSQVLKDDLVGLTEDESSRAELMAQADVLAGYLRNENSSSSRDFRAACEADRGSNVFCGVIVSGEGVSESRVPLAIRQRYAATLRSLSGPPAQRALVCRNSAERALAEIIAPSSGAASLRAEAIYWLRECKLAQAHGPTAVRPVVRGRPPARGAPTPAPAGGALSPAEQASRLLDLLWNRYPLDFHTVSAMEAARDPRLAEALALRTDYPVLMRSQRNEAFNAVLSGIEALYRKGFNAAAALVGQRLGEQLTASEGGAQVEPQARLYFASLMARVGRKIPSVLPVGRALRPLLRERHEYVSRTTLEMLFPVDVQVVVPGEEQPVLIADLLRAEAGREAGFSLLMGLAHYESALDPRARSNQAAFGLMQTLLRTADDQYQLLPEAERTVPLTAEMLLNPRLSARLGARVIVANIRFFEGDAALGLAGYHAGNSAVDNWRKTLPPIADPTLRMDLIFMNGTGERSTAKYVSNVLARSAWYRLLSAPEGAPFPALPSQAPPPPPPPAAPPGAGRRPAPPPHHPPRRAAAAPEPASNTSVSDATP